MSYTALIEAARAVVARWDTPAWKDAPNTGEVINRLRDALAVDAAPAPVAQPDSREAFEAWIKRDSTLPITRGVWGYTDMTTALMWHAWQAATKEGGTA